MNKAVLALAALLALAACAPQSVVVLVPDADGHVGRIEVAAQGGVVVLDQPNNASSATAGKPPSPAKALSEQQIKQDWGDALAAMPARPVTFQLYFDSGTADPVPQARVLIAQAVALAAQRPHVFVMVAGHADSVGSAEVNDRISRRRADAVLSLLLEQGMSAKSIQTSSHGKRNPLVPTADGVAEPRNRRVTLTVQ
ncbi:OmpA family protein [Magnetospirillum sulfuroxidans]|uniref:OmpA family protein n=1 Tax=Magnetospirillum sulfuroxidans TaxID=611300 RepID=A0ABS5I9J5_9PROT|nr:OmpA family protein [Magnetospirillum sulfuroxidans]MBR9970368.1 OmpA family protein [Magnetospirillum sulfuroxidans]